jgi:indoleamine 2,3-dioxygenase
MTVFVQGNPMFPEGVIYEGVGDEKPQYFRGESGANDSMSVGCLAQ